MPKTRWRQIEELLRAELARPSIAPATAAAALEMFAFRLRQRANGTVYMTDEHGAVRRYPLGPKKGGRPVAAPSIADDLPDDFVTAAIEHLHGLIKNSRAEARRLKFRTRQALAAALVRAGDASLMSGFLSLDPEAAPGMFAEDLAAAAWDRTVPPKPAAAMLFLRLIGAPHEIEDAGALLERLKKRGKTHPGNR